MHSTTTSNPASWLTSSSSLPAYTLSSSLIAGQSPHDGSPTSILSISGSPGAGQTPQTATYFCSDPFASSNYKSICTALRTTPAKATQSALTTKPSVPPHHISSPQDTSISRLSSGEIAGLIIGAIVLPALLVALGYYIGRRYRKPALHVHFEEAVKGGDDDRGRWSTMVWFHRATSRLSGMLLGNSDEVSHISDPT